jgi:hypothetical protein
MIELRNKLPGNTVGTGFSQRSGMPAQAASFLHGQDSSAQDVLALKFGVRKSGTEKPSAAHAKSAPRKNTAQKAAGTARTSGKRTNPTELSPTVERAADAVQKGVSFWDNSHFLNETTPGQMIKNHKILAAASLFFVFNLGKGIVDGPVREGHKAVTAVFEKIVGKDSPDQASNLALGTELALLGAGGLGLYAGGRKLKQVKKQLEEGRQQKELAKLEQIRAAVDERVDKRVDQRTKRLVPKVVQSEIKKLQNEPPQKTASGQGKDTDKA